MSNVPFVIVCTSCEAKIEVRNAGLVGQIAACPKCGCMVEITPPQTENKNETQTANKNLTQTENQNHLQTESQNHNEIVESFSEHFASSEINSADTTISETTQTTAENEDEILQSELNNDFVQENFIQYESQILAEKKTFHQIKRVLTIAALVVAILAVLLLACTIFYLWNYSASQKSNSQSPIPEQTTTENTTSANEKNNAEIKEESKKNENAETAPIENIEPKNENEQSAAQNNNPDEKNHDEKFENKFEDKKEISQTPPITVKTESPQELSSNLLPDPFGYLDEENPADISKANVPHTETSKNDKNDHEKKPDEKTQNSIAEENKITTLPKQTPLENKNISSQKTEQTKSAINIDERLRLPVASIKFEKTPIAAVIETLSDLSGVPMQLDVDELRARNISVETPLTLQLQNTTLAGAIDAVLKKTHLTRRGGEHEIVFGYSSEEMSSPQTIHYDLTPIATLEKNPITAETAAKWLSELLIAQKNPKTQNAVVAADGNVVVVSGNRWLQDQAKRLLLSLYYLRDLEPQMNFPPERLAPEVFGWDNVNLPLSFHLVEPIPLKQAARMLSRHTKIRILIDYAALHEQGLSCDLPITAHINNGTFDTVLQGILEPLDLTYRIVEANAVEITTPQAAHQAMTIEAQHYAPLAPEKTPESCATTMQQAFGGEKDWNTSTGGVIIIDEISGYMLVRQTQPLQRAIRLWMGKMQKEME